MARFRAQLQSPALWIALLALFVALGGTGYAVLTSGVPDTQGVFHGCANKRSGALRVVRTAGACRSKKRGFPGELPIAWQQRGLPGAAGAAGSNGRDGARIVARLSSTQALTTSTSVQSYALNPATWTQAADAINDWEAVIAYHAPATTKCASQSNPVYLPGQLKVTIKVDGTDYGTMAAVTDTAAADKTDRLGLRIPFWDTGAKATHTVSLDVSDTCNAAAPQTSVEHFQITGVKVAVIAYR